MRRWIAAAACLGLIALAPQLGHLDADTGSFVLWQLRVPRVLLGALVGSTLSVVGAAYQTLFENPLAEPGTTGTMAGATLGALAVIILAPTLASMGIAPVAVAAFLGALAVSLTVSAMASSGRASIHDVLLVGIALTLASGALTTGLQVQADMAATFRAVRWSLGSLSQVGYAGVVGLLPLAALAQGAILSQVRALDALVGGEDLAHAQGVDVRRVRALVLGAGALGVGGCVAACGPIAFVGLVVPHLVRRTLGAELRVLLPMSAVVGAAFLVTCDVAARLAWSGREIPVGALTAAIGAPALLALVLRRDSA
jgi:iron complex transport system permease protein